MLLSRLFVKYKDGARRLFLENIKIRSRPVCLQVDHYSFMTRNSDCLESCLSIYVGLKTPGSWSNNTVALKFLIVKYSI